MGNQKTILTPKDLSEITGKSLRLIYRELRKNNIPHVKCGDISETGVAFRVTTTWGDSVLLWVD